METRASSSSASRE